MKQVLFGNSGASAPTGTVYAAPMQADASWNATEANVRAPWPTPGVLRNLVVDISAAPTVGNSRTFTLRKTGSGTALTVTISDTATTARITGTDVAVTTGDLLALEHTGSGSPASATARWSLEFEGTTAKESGYALVLTSASQAGSPRAAGLFTTTAGTFSTSPPPANIANIVAAAGTLTRLIASVDTAPGVGNGYTFYVNKNGTRQDGSGGSVNTACALVGAITSASATFSLALVAGDLAYVEAVASGTFTVRWSLGATFVATTDGEYQVCGGATGSAPLSASATAYYPVAGMTGQTGATETAFARRAAGGVTAIRLSQFRLYLATAPGSGKSRTLDLRNNATSPGPTITISDTATTGSDLVNTATISDGDLFDLRSVPTSSPVSTLAAWSYIANVPAAPVTATETVTTYVVPPR